MNKLKALLLFSCISFLSQSTYAKFYSIINKEHQLVGTECKILIYSIFYDNNNMDPTDDGLIGTYSVVIGKDCADPESSTVEVENVSSNKKSGIYLITSALEVQPVSEEAKVKKENISSNCYLVSTLIYNDNGTLNNKKDDFKVGTHHVSVKSVDGIFVDSRGMCFNLNQTGYNFQFISHGLNNEIKADDPEYTKKLNEYLKSVSQ